MKKSLTIILITMFIQAELLAQIAPIGFNAVMSSHLKVIKIQSFQPNHILPIINKLNGQQSKNKDSKDTGEEKEQVTRATIGEAI
jgi:hypothetical protein